MPAPSLVLRLGATLLSTACLLSRSASAASTHYVLDTDYSGTSFFDNWNFYDGPDPTHGFVTYVGGTTAYNNGLISFNGGSVQMSADDTHYYNGNAAYSGVNGVGRPSVRIETQDSWTHGLFLADIKHLPTTKTTSGCGTWPAFWTLGSGTWPYNGEIDIIEGANNQNTDLSSAHTANTCTVAQSPLQMTGTTNGNNCQYNVQTGANSQGCGSFDQRTTSWGDGFNANGGGVYAMEWKSSAIKIWFFPRGSIPQDISSGNPDPTGWGIASSIFNGPNCDVDANFNDHRIIFDMTFCGDFGDATWNNGCSALTNTPKCSNFVGNNPSEFSETYWDINYVQVYQLKPVVTTTTTTTTSTTRTTLLTTTTTAARTTTATTAAPTTTTTTAVRTTTTTTAAATTTTTTAKRTTTTTTTAAATTTTSFAPGKTTTTTSSAPGKTTTTASSAPGKTTTTTSSAPGKTTTTTSSAAGKPTTTTTTAAAVTTTSSSGAVRPVTTSTTVPPVFTTTAPPHVGPTSSSRSWGPFRNGTWTAGTSTFVPTTWDDWTSTTTVPVVAVTTSTTSSVWEDWTTTTTTTTKHVDPTDTWSDWVDPSKSTTTKHVDPTDTWSDWVDPSKSTTTKHVDPTDTWSDWVDPSKSTTTTTPLATWSDWVDTVVTITLTKTWVEPCPTGYITKTVTVVTTHCGCTETPVPTIPVTVTTIVPGQGWPIATPVVVTIPVTTGSWPSVAPAAAGQGGWAASPSATIPTTMTVAPLQSSPAGWKPAAASATVADTTKPWVAAYTGAAARSNLNALSVVAAGGVALLAAAL